MLSVPSYRDDIRMSEIRGNDINVCSTATQQIVKIGEAPQFRALFCYDRNAQTSLKKQREKRKTSFSAAKRSFIQ